MHRLTTLYEGQVVDTAGSRFQIHWPKTSQNISDPIPAYKVLLESGGAAGIKDKSVPIKHAPRQKIYLFPIVALILALVSVGI